ncbi:MAG TPA: NADH-quinone oxidoreductase subunit NuoF [Salinivirgaceae bacterium]|nr:NADH-quinone oxidoreductase subunit NuoF [Salinivirgaceae bacterium]
MTIEKRLVLKRVGMVDPLNIDQAIRCGAYESLRKVLRQDSDEINQIIKKSGLRGRGGAGFPTGLKTDATHQSQTLCMKFVVCNADEGEPGTFKDRAIMENDPHLLIEGILIAAYAVEATQGYIYIRGEYSQAIATLEMALQQAHEKGFLGKNILGSNFTFSLDIMIGAGSYLCGEEFTLLESLEGKRGYPRIKPPFPAEKGLWGQPTLVNNVETLANLPILFDIGLEEYLKLGTEGTPGTKLICLSGDVKNPGVYEIEPGTTIRQVIEMLGGGTKDGSSIKAVLLGGAAGTFANPMQLDTPIGFLTMKEQRLTLGSGAIIVFSQKSSLLKALQSILRFFKHESCGKCVPCRVGTYHLERMADDLVPFNQSKCEILQKLLEISQQIAATSLCPLGQSPLLPIRSLIENCRNELLLEK